MNRFRSILTTRILFLALAVTAIAALTLRGGANVAAAQSTPRSASPANPQYDEKGAVRLPADYRQWVFVGSSLGLSYTEGQPAMEMFHETLMEPSAYKHFVETATFREGTMLALILHGPGENVLPGRHGRFAAAVHGVEMAVKDSSHRPEGWAYYNFAGANGIRLTAAAMPKESCYSCHAEHAKRDNVFLQFYPLLAEAAHISTSGNDAAAADMIAYPAPATTPTAKTPTEPLALKGLDPVALVDGREEMGKPEIVEAHGPYRYQFVSEPNRARFAKDPARFAIQNSTCLVVPGAQIDPTLFAVYEGHIYGFATTDCVSEFKDQPAKFVKKP